MRAHAHTALGLVAALAAFGGIARAQNDIRWSTIDAGGSTSTGDSGSGLLSVTGTIGQFDAGATMTGSSAGQTFTLVGGFWADAKCPADYNADQSVDFFDYLDFVGAFDTGCE